ncbi:MAG: ion transporter [Gammaproteobacteria bacterium]
MKVFSRHLLSDGNNEAGDAQWQKQLFVVIFKTDTRAGKLFDLILIAAIIASVVTISLYTVEPIRDKHATLIFRAEWLFTIIFTIEYLLRLACVRQPIRYARSFYGIIDLLAVLPSYLELLLTGSGYLMLIRILRVLRVFRVLKLRRYVGEADSLVSALRASARKILVFVFAVITLVVIFGSIMYLVEGAESGFTSIPRGIYWSIVTLTTVGYGDITPQTPLGQFISAIIMIMGYGIIAVPTGIYAAELGQAIQREKMEAICPACGALDHDSDAAYCKKCGKALLHRHSDAQ